MDYPASRLMSAATMAYGVFAAVKPRHLADNMKASPAREQTWDKVAYGYALRDIPVSLAGVLGPGRAVEAAMKARIVSDLTDCLALGVAANDGRTRGKMMGLTLGWAALNAAALTYDRRRSAR